jgi:hypothetical protein
MPKLRLGLVGVVEFDQGFAVATPTESPAAGEGSLEVLPDSVGRGFGYIAEVEGGNGEKFLGGMTEAFEFCLVFFSVAWGHIGGAAFHADGVFIIGVFRFSVEGKM